MSLATFLIIIDLQQAKMIAEKADVEVQMPRQAKRLHKSNPPAANAEEYFRRTTSIPLLDKILFEMESDSMKWVSERQRWCT